MTNFNKFLSYISFLFLCFFLFNIDVNAKLYNSGDCIYNFNKVNASIRINQDVSGNVKYYFSFEKLTSSDAQGWGEVGDIIHIDADNNNSIYDKCPKYAHYKQDEVTGFINFYFSDNKKENESYQEDVAVNSSPKLNAPPLSDDGKGATCAQTKEPDWYNPVPSANDLVKDEAHCLYQGENDTGCHVFQLDYDPATDDIIATGNFLSWYDTEPFGYYFTEFAPFDEGKAKLRLKLGCPNVVGFNAGWVELYLAFNNKAVYTFKSEELLTLKLVKSVSEHGSSAVIIPDDPSLEITKCEDILTDDVIGIIKTVILCIRIIVPIILICLGVADFGMAIFASDEEKMKKAQSKFISRLIIGVVVFLIPSILKMFLSLAHLVWPVVDATLCGII